MSQIIFPKFSHIWSGHVKTAGSAVVRLVGRQCLVMEHIQAALLWNNTSCLVDFLSSAILFPVTPMNSLCCDKLWSCFCRWARLLHGIFCRKKWNKKKQSKTFGIRYLQNRQSTAQTWHWIPFTFHCFPFMSLLILLTAMHFVSLWTTILFWPHLFCTPSNWLFILSYAPPC